MGAAVVAAERIAARRARVHHRKDASASRTHYVTRPAPPTGAPFSLRMTYHARTQRIFGHGSRAMKCSKRSFAVVSVFFALVLSLGAGTLNAGDSDPTSHTFAAAQTAKQKCMNTCRARYRDCRRLNQLPSFECRNVYEDCTRYTCTGLGPG